MHLKIFGFKHEAMTEEIIQNTEIGQILSNANIDISTVIGIIRNTTAREFRLLSQLISSQLDVDRLDYLGRDAYFTGVGFSSVDIERIIHMMEIYDGNGELNGYAVIAKVSCPSWIILAIFNADV